MNFKEKINMGIKYKRAFIGYSTKDVERREELLEEEFQENYNESIRQLEELRMESQRLEDKISNKKYDMTKSKSLKDDLEKIIIRKHMEAASLIYEAEQKYEAMIKYKSDILNKHQSKNQEVKESINKLLKKVQVIVDTEA
jgi:hypothetical protein